MEGPDGLKAFAKELVSAFSVGKDAAQFSVVSFAEDATTRVAWSHDEAEIGAGVDEMDPRGRRGPTRCYAVGCTHRLLAACCAVLDTTRVRCPQPSYSLPYLHCPARRSRTASSGRGSSSWRGSSLPTKGARQPPRSCCSSQTESRHARPRVHAPASASAKCTNTVSTSYLMQTPPCTCTCTAASRADDRRCAWQDAE